MDIDQILSRRHQPRMRSLSEQLQTDANFRAEFVKDPASALAGFGIKAPEGVSFDPRNQFLIELFVDPKVNELYLSGQVDQLRDYILERHQAIVGSSLDEVAGWAIADFDVAIEAEAVAVAVVAVAAIAIGAIDAAERLRLIEADAGATAARLEALEARVRMLQRLETRMNNIESRLG